MKHNQLFSMIKNKKDWTHCNKSDIVTYQPPFPRWYHIRRVNVGRFGIIKLFKPKTYHTNYSKTVPEKTIKNKRG